LGKSFREALKGRNGFPASGNFYFAPSGLVLFLTILSRGVAPGYYITPLRGWNPPNAGGLMKLK
jgi:hypothetical protein